MLGIYNRRAWEPRILVPCQVVLGIYNMPHRSSRTLLSLTVSSTVRGGVLYSDRLTKLSQPTLRRDRLFSSHREASKLRAAVTCTGPGQQRLGPDSSSLSNRRVPGPEQCFTEGRKGVCVGGGWSWGAAEEDAAGARCPAGELGAGRSPCGRSQRCPDDGLTSHARP